MQKFKLLSIVLLFALLAQPIFAQNRDNTILRILMMESDESKKKIASLNQQQIHNNVQIEKILQQITKEKSTEKIIRLAQSIADLKQQNAKIEENINNLKKKGTELEKRIRELEEKIKRLEEEERKKAEERKNNYNIIEQGKCGNNATWVLTKDLILTISGSGAMNNYDARNLTPWNKYKEKIQQIYISDGITSIGNYAFYECGLCKLKIASTVTSIGEAAFFECSHLTGKLDFPKKLTYIGREAFTRTNLLIVNFDSNIDRIVHGAFSDCHNLASVQFGGNVGTIAWGTFFGCNNLASVEFYGNVGTIEHTVFADCTKLKRFRITGKCQKIKNHAFDNCIELDSATIPYGTQIENGAFPNQTKIIRH